MSRIRPRLSFMRDVAESVDTRDQEFDILQVIFMDFMEGHMEDLGAKGADRLCQIEVGIPNLEPFSSDLDSELLEQIISRVRSAVETSNLSNDKKAEVLALLCNQDHE